MKRTLLLGLSALAAAAWVPLAGAGEVSLGGFYEGRWMVYDANMIKETATQSEGERFVQGLELKVDMKASEKSHAHLLVEVIDGNNIEGADLGNVSDLSTTATPGLAAWNRVSPSTANDPGSSNFWEIRQAWLETEAWGIGVKFGTMPLSLNDSILVGMDSSGFGGLLLSKTFGDVTVVAGDIRINEGRAGGTTANNTNFGASQDDANLFAVAAFGKAGLADYNLTLAYADIGRVSSFQNALNGACAGTSCNDSNNLWAALTLSGKLGYVNAVGTVIYEAGYDLKNNTTGAKLSNQLTGSGVLGALRLNGPTSFGEWNAYGFMASRNFNNITNDNMNWSSTWAQEGPAKIDLLNTFAASAGSSSPSENMSGIGAGLKIKAAGWTINPMLDYARVTKTNVGDNFKSATGGSLLLSTEIQKDTTLLLETAMIRPSGAPATINTDNAYYAQASVKVVF
ncbi:MAG: hypothetical protein HQL77_00510 [Magnetococcales bacterium]|nr:hypothetical protein [Magnetococcales bacterium]